MITERIYHKAKTVQEALNLASQFRDDFCFVAGGTDIMVNKFQGNESAACLIDLTGIEELKSVKQEDDYLKIGSLVRLADLKKHAEINKEFPILIEAAHSVASPVIRRTATLGGNILCENRCVFYNQSEWWREAVGYCLKCDGDICIATGGAKNCFSKFASDTAIALISMDASIEIASADSISIIKLTDIYTGDGINPRRLDKNIIIKHILLPLHRQFRCSYKKLRQRESMDFSSLTSCVSIDKNGNIKIALGAVDPKPILVEGSINDDKNLLIQQAFKKARVIDNDVFSRKYRREMIKVLLGRSFEEIEKDS